MRAGNASEALRTRAALAAMYVRMCQSTAVTGIVPLRAAELLEEGELDAGGGLKPRVE